MRVKGKSPALLQMPKEGADSLDLNKELCLLRMLTAAICMALIDQQREMLVYWTRYENVTAGCGRS